MTSRPLNPLPVPPEPVLPGQASPPRLRTSASLGGAQGEGAHADICQRCGCLLPRNDKAANDLHADWHDTLERGLANVTKGT